MFIKYAEKLLQILNCEWNISHFNILASIGECGNVGFMNVDAPFWWN